MDTGLAHEILDAFAKQKQTTEKKPAKQQSELLSKMRAAVSLGRGILDLPRSLPDPYQTTFPFSPPRKTAWDPIDSHVI